MAWRDQGFSTLAARWHFLGTLKKCARPGTLLTGLHEDLQGEAGLLSVFLFPIQEM